MNEEANRIDRVFDTFSQELETVVLYPGDIYDVGQPHDSRNAVDRYLADQGALSGPVEDTAERVGLDTLVGLAVAARTQLGARNWLGLLGPLRAFGFFRPVGIFLTDHGVGVRYSMFKGIFEHGLRRQDCQIALRSRSLSLMLRTGFGFGTLCVNGCLEELKPGALKTLSRHFAIAAQNEEGYTLLSMLLRPNYVFAQIKSRMRSLFGCLLVKK